MSGIISRFLSARPDYHDVDTVRKAISLGDRLVLVQFSADWCAPCKRMTPIAEKSVRKFGDKIALFRLNVEDDRSMFDEYSVRGLPFWMLFRNGAPIAQWFALNRQDFVTNLESSLPD